MADTIELTSYPWNTSEDMYEAQWRAFMRHLRRTGVVREDPSDLDALDEFEVYGDSTGMQVKVKSGSAYMIGVVVPSEDEEILSIEAADPADDRIDRVYLKIDTVARTVTLGVETGTPAGSPSAPTLTDTSSVKYIKLAQVAVDHGVTTIAASDVTDEREFYSHSAKIVREETTASTLTPNAGDEVIEVNALASALTINAPVGTPKNGQTLVIRLKDNGSARALTWNAIYQNIALTKPTTTKISKWLYVGFMYNATADKWDLLAVAEEA